MKGKKFSAAEKHFMYKEQKYRDEIIELKKQISRLIVDKQELQLGVEGLRLINDGYYDLISLYGEYIHKASTNEVSERSFKEFADNKNLAKDLVSLLYGGDKYL